MTINNNDQFNILEYNIPMGTFHLLFVLCSQLNFWDIFFRPPKPRSACSAQGCTNLKKYSCSSNNLPVCSMACYKKVQLIPRQTATAV